MQQPLPTPEEQKRQLEAERKLTHRRHAETESAFARGLVYPNSGPSDEMLQVWRHVWERDGGKCVRCDTEWPSSFCYVVPPSRGGVDEPANLVVLCRDCSIPVAAEAERVGTGIALLQRIVPPEVDREPPKYVVPKHHQIAKTIWIIGAIALPTLLLAVASDDFATTIIVELFLLFGMLLILPVAVGLSHLYDRFLLPEKLQAEAAHEAWQQVCREWQKQRPKIARMGMGTRSRYISNRVKGEVWARDSGRCVECGSNVDLQFDHVIPYSFGGGNHAANIQLLCKSCNLKKSNKIDG